MTSLHIRYEDLEFAVRQYLGNRTDADEDREHDLVNHIIQSGYRQFLAPPPLPGQSKAHEWSFLAPRLIVTTTASQAEYTLPEEFGGMLGGLYYDSSDSGRIELNQTSVSQIQRFQQRTTSNNQPTRFAIDWVASQGLEIQRKTLIVWPTPNAQYTLHGRFNFDPPALSREKPFPLGGLSHGETIKASCLYVAESEIQNEAGEKQAKFYERLAASIAIDSRSSRAEHFHNYGDKVVGFLDRPVFRITHVPDGLTYLGAS